MLRRIHIRGFKSLVDVQTELKPLVVLFGPNAVGKSNFLEALTLFSRLVTERTLSDAFDRPLRGYPAEAFSLSDRGLPGSLAQDSLNLSIEGDLSVRGHHGGGQREDLRYRVGVHLTPKSGALELSDEFLARLRKDGEPDPKPRIEKLQSQLAIRQLGGPGAPLKIALGGNHTVASNLQYSGETRFPQFDRLRKELTSWHSYYLDPRLTMREPQPPREVEDIGPQGEFLAPFLYRLKNHPQFQRNFKAIRRGLSSAIPTIEGLDVELDERRGTLDIVITQNGAPYSSRVISEGTLRIIALCAIAANPWPSSLVAFEEPENGVQPKRIKVIASLLTEMATTSERQVVVTTHSPILVAAIASKALEDSKRVALLHCTQDGRETRIKEMNLLGLRDDREGTIDRSLMGPEDAALVAMELHGWFDA